MDPKYSFRAKAAQYFARAQTEHDPLVRAAAEDLARDYLRLAEGSGTDTALTVDFEIPSGNQSKAKH